MAQWIDSKLEFTEAQIKEALIWHYDLPKDTKVRFENNVQYDFQERPTGSTFKAIASFKQDLKRKSKEAE